jgi:rRNA-processing protein FCF1
MIGLLLLSFITQVSSQLMEAVQQKVALSQQLEEWESDLQVMFQEQVKEKLVQNTANRSGKASGSDTESETVTRKLPRPSSIISFFAR